MPRAWDVWFYPFPFTDDRTVRKTRPVVVKSVLGDSCTVLYVTSHVEKQDFPDFVLLQEWWNEGLSKPSAVRCFRGLAMPVAELQRSGRRVGVLSPVDRVSVIHRLGRFGV